MAIVVNHPVLGEVSFPDNYTPQQIDAELLQIGASILPEKSSGEVFFNQLGEGFEATFEGLGQLTGLGGEYTQEDYIDEFQNRVELEQSPVAGYGGYVVGAILDPVTIPAAFLKPIAIGGKITTGLARGATAGTLYGATAPVYEEFGDSRLLNTTVGGVFGGALGGALSKITASDIKPPAPEKIDDAVDSVLEDVADAVTPQVRVSEIPEPQPIPIGPERAIAQLQEELSPIAQPALKAGDRKATEELVSQLQTRVTNMERTKPKRGSQVAKNLEETKQQIKVLQDKLNKNTPEAQAARLDLENLQKGSLNKLSSASAQRIDELSTLQVTPKTPIQQAVRTQADTLQQQLADTAFFVRPETTRPLISTPITKTLEQISEDSKQVIQRAVRGEPEPTPTLPQRQFTMEDIMTRRVVGSGAARVSPLQTADELNLKWNETARLQSEGTGGPRMVTRKYLPSDAAPGTPMTSKVEPGAFPEFEFPAGPVRNYAAKLYQSLNKLRYGANVARGRGETRGSGTRQARINAAERWITNLEEEGKYVEDFILAADRGDIGATQILGSARVQQDIQEIIAKQTEDFEKLVDEFGSIDAIPKALYDEHIARSIPALMVNAKLSGALTEASDMLNASKWVKQALGLDAKGKATKARMTELFGTRCI